MPQTSRFPDIAKPETERRPQAATVHGITRIDEYAWLRADNWQEVFKDPATLDPEIRSHLEAENAYIRPRSWPIRPNCARRCLRR